MKTGHNRLSTTKRGWYTALNFGTAFRYILRRGNRTLMTTMPGESDAALISRIRDSRDEDAFMELVERYQGKVYGMALRYTGRPQDAEDVTQEVFLKVHKKLKSFRAEAAFSTWLYRVAANTCYSHMRGTRKMETLSVDADLPKFKEDGHHLTPPADWSSRADELLLRKELKTILEDAIVALPENLRIVLVLRDIEGHSNRSVAQVLNLRIEAVKSRLHRARLMVRGRLSSYLEKHE